MTTIPLDEIVHFDVMTHNPSTGAISDADAVPTFSVFEEDTDTPMFAVTNLTKRTALTGNYRGIFTASAANGFEVGKFYSVNASATVGAVAGKTVALSFRLINAETVAGFQKVDTCYFGGVTGTFAAGRPEVNTSHAAGTAWNTGGITAATLATDAITSTGLAASAATEIAAAVFDRALSSHVTAGTAGKALSDVDVRGRRVVGRGTVGAASTTTSIVTSAMAPAGSVADQFKGRIVTFDDDTITVALRGQATDITASSAIATPTFTVTALTTAAVSGDTFSIT